MSERGLVLAGSVEAPWQLAPWGGRSYTCDLNGAAPQPVAAIVQNWLDRHVPPTHAQE